MSNASNRYGRLLQICRKVLNYKSKVGMQDADRAGGCIPLPFFRCLFGAQERPDPPRPGVPLYGLLLDEKGEIP